MSDPAQLEAASKLEAAGKYREALELLKQKPAYDSTYFFNMGILYGKSNQPGLATAYLEKANRLNPHDPEIMANLKFARSQLQQQLAAQRSEVTLDSASNDFERFADRIQSDEILGVIGLITVVVSLLWIRAYLKTRNIVKTFLKPSGWFGVFALVLAFAFYGVYKVGIINPPAVVLVTQPLRSGPGVTYPEITNIGAGVKIRMVGSAVTVNENELWQKVRYKSEQTAWLPLSSLLPL
jgi:tetratricopeptide (TPR) repeat protein